MGARLGQHFLFDPAILGRIADAALLTSADTVLEIGPGRGTLTRELLARAGRVIAIETDRALAEALRQSAPDTLTVIHGDALKVAWPAADVVAGNIPYQITSPLIERALTRPRPKRIVFLVQQEVAARLAADPGGSDYGALSAGVQLVATVERLFGVKRGAFRPAPRVDSALVRITPRTEPLVEGAEEEAAARGLIQALFQRRRQQIQRSLRESLGLDAGTVGEMLARVGIQPTDRAEELGPPQLVALARLAPRA
ncbi:MAG: 16S rRNA (adenine(1518)-N(6)/adenine(1519)-N(6))-dimethyltransferase RsmA [Gemmatimonadales bacterium]